MRDTTTLNPTGTIASATTPKGGSGKGTVTLNVVPYLCNKYGVELPKEVSRL